MVLETVAVMTKKSLLPAAESEQFGQTTQVRPVSVCAATKLIDFLRNNQARQAPRVAWLDLTQIKAIAEEF